MPFAHLESTIQDIHKMTIVQKESMRPAKQGIKKGKSVYTDFFIFKCMFFFAVAAAAAALVVFSFLNLFWWWCCCWLFFLFSLLIPTVSFSYKNLPFVIREAAVLIMYLVDVHIFTAVTTVCWIIWSVCVCAFMRQMCRIFSLSSPHIFFFSSVFRFFFIGIGFFLSLCVCLFPAQAQNFSLPLIFLILFFSLHSFTWFWLNHFGDCHHIQLYLRQCEFIEYINNRFLLALRYLIIIYYQCCWSAMY